MFYYKIDGQRNILFLIYIHILCGIFYYIVSSVQREVIRQWLVGCLLAGLLVTEWWIKGTDCVFKTLLS